MGIYETLVMGPDGHFLWMVVGYSGLLAGTVQYVLLGFDKVNDRIRIPAVER